PTVTPGNASVTWSVTATDANALEKSLAGTGYQDAPLLESVATATANVATTCAGSPVVLTAALATSGQATIGTDTALSGDWDQPTAFNNRWSSYTHQTIFTAAELSAAGLSAGNITAITYNTATLGSGATNANF